METSDIRASIELDVVDQDNHDALGFELVPLGTPFVVDQIALARRGSMAPTLQQVDWALQRVKRVYCGVRYWLGDLMNLTDTLFHDEASQLIDQSFLSEQEVKEYCFVAAKVSPTVRGRAASWEHAKAVARLPEDEQLTWLERAQVDDWSARKLATEIAIAGAKGKTEMRFWLIVECGTEAKRDKLADELGPRGFSVKKQEKLRKVPKPKKAKKGPITAKAKRGPRANTRRRTH